MCCKRLTVWGLRCHNLQAVQGQGTSSGHLLAQARDLVDCILCIMSFGASALEYACFRGLSDYVGTNIDEVSHSSLPILQMLFFLL
jgi:hypothetical protein